MSERERTPVEVAAAEAMRAQSRDLVYVATSARSLETVASAVAGAVEAVLAPEYDRKRQESVIAATHAASRWRGEVVRVKERLDRIERAAAPHLAPETDPCAKGGEAWPCHIAAAIEPDTSLLEFLAKEDTL